MVPLRGWDDTADGRKILHHLIGSSSHYLHRFFTSRLVQDFFHQRHVQSHRFSWRIFCEGPLWQSSSQSRLNESHGGKIRRRIVELKRDQDLEEQTANGRKKHTDTYKISMYTFSNVKKHVWKEGWILRLRGDSIGDNENLSRLFIWTFGSHQLMSHPQNLHIPWKLKDEVPFEMVCFWGCFRGCTFW